MSESDKLKFAADKLLRNMKKSKEEKADEKRLAENFLVNLRRRKKFREFRANKGRFVK